MILKKAFDSLNHNLILAVLEKYIWGGHTTHYFNLECGTPQGDLISEYLFILVLEILFILTKSKKNIHGIKISSMKNFFWKQTFFKKDIISVKIVFRKCETAGIDILKNNNMALCGIKNVDLTKETIK